MRNATASIGFLGSAHVDVQPQGEVVDQLCRAQHAAAHAQADQASESG